jgi:hypothetical protein
MQMNGCAPSVGIAFIHVQLGEPTEQSVELALAKADTYLLFHHGPSAPNWFSSDGQYS